MNSKNRKFNESLVNNTDTYFMFLNTLTNIATSMFKWINLPPSVDERFLELTLFTDGLACFIQDPDIDIIPEKTYLTLQCTYGMNLNVYGNPQNFIAWGLNSYHKEVAINDGVIIYNNFSRTNTLSVMQQFAERLYEIQRAIDVNVKQQKTPRIILCDESQRITLKNLMKEYDGNIPFIFGEKFLANEIGHLSSIDNSVPYLSDKLQALKRQVFNEALTYLGVENDSSEKKERLVAGEITSNLGGVDAQRYVGLASRQQACEKINQIFGLNVSVEYKQSYFTTPSQSISDTNSGGEKD